MLGRTKDGWTKPGAGNSQNQYLLLSIFVLLMLAHTVYVTSIVKVPQRPPQSVEEIQRVVPSEDPHRNEPQLPDVIIYRRTKKTGSSSMLEQLLVAIAKFNYVPLYHEQRQLSAVVRGENIVGNPRRMLIATHNSISRKDTKGRSTIIVDTIMDGYKQVTSYCRYSKHIENCDNELIKCLEDRNTLSQRYYRWGGNLQEDDSTYIDLPLSSEHPALSTTVFRRVFKNATLDVARRNAMGTACAEVPAVRATYNKHYRDLDAQVAKLRMRMLALAGYPLIVKRGSVTVEEMMEKAEEIERQKYDFVEHESTRGVSDEHRELRRNEKAWSKSDAGAVFLQNAHA